MKNFVRNKSGNVAVTFAVLAVPLFGIAGAALDYSRLVNERSTVQSNIDAAILAGVYEAQSQIQQGARKNDAVKIAETLAKDFFKISLVEDGIADQGRFVPNIKFNGQSISGTATYDAKLDTTLLGAMGIVDASYQVDSEVNLANSQFLELNFVIDNSNSMGIGASAADQTTMEASMGCAFACHVPQVPFNNDPQLVYTDHTNTIEDARALGVSLRIDVAKNAVSDIIDQIETSGLGNTIKIGVYTFSNYLEVVERPTNDFNMLRNSVDAITLSNDWGAGGTSFDHSLTELENEIGNSGTGKSAQDAKKIVFLMTDAISTNFKYWISDPVQAAQAIVTTQTTTSSGGLFTFQTTTTTTTTTSGVGATATYQSTFDPNWERFNPSIEWGVLGPFANLQGFDPEACRNLKSDKGVEMYTLNLEYVIPGPGPSRSHDSRFNDIEQRLKPFIENNMSNCASSPDKSLNAKTPDEISDQLKQMVGSATRSTGLVLSK